VGITFVVGLTTDAAGNLYVLDTGGLLLQVTPSGSICNIVQSSQYNGQQPYGGISIYDDVLYWVAGTTVLSLPVPTPGSSSTQLLPVPQPCAITAPTNGDLGSCGTSLTGGTTCTGTCNSG
jgi:hypothetical protein